MWRNPYAVVREFEEAVAEYAGSRYAVAVDSCTSAIFLCCKLLRVRDVTMPARTWLSVPMSVIHAGGSVSFRDYTWNGVYQLEPYPIWDGAMRFRRSMYAGGLHCLSFVAGKKHVPIGKGGMVLTDDANHANWLRKARCNGRSECPIEEDDVKMLGWNMYMTPEQAARGLLLLHHLPENMPDKVQEFPDLSQMRVFRDS